MPQMYFSGIQVKIYQIGASMAEGERKNGTLL